MRELTPKSAGRHFLSPLSFGRWSALFSGNDLCRRYLKGKILDKAQQQRLTENIKIWREQLIDISWCMGCLNDKIIGNDFEQLCWP